MEDSGPSRENLMWTESQMDYLVHLLVDQSRIPGMKSGGGLKAKAYTAIEKSMIDRFGREFTKDKIKNKLKYAKPNLTVMKDILNTSGFGYDPLNKCIDVDPQVWAEYIEKYPNRRKYKGPRLWRYFDEFIEVYGDSHATGRESYTCSSVQSDENLESFQTTPTSYMQHEPSQSYTEMLHENNPLPQSPIPPSPTTQDPTSTSNRTTNRSKRSRPACDDEYINLLHGIADDVKTLTTQCKSFQFGSSYEILEELIANGEIEPDTMLKCMDIIADGTNSLVFHMLRPSRRVAWLKSKLGGS